MKQPTISTFFTSTVTKRTQALDSGDISSKKVKPNDSEKMKCEPDAASDGNFLEICDRLSVLDREIGCSWFRALLPEFNKSYFKTLSEFVEKERKVYKIYPEHSDVWAWTKLCTLEVVKVVIIGQDPYHNPKQAHGLCFSVPRGIRPPPSLLNIYKELGNDIPGFKAPGHGDLTGWARQGILLLNASLTVRENSPNSHSEKGWQNLTDAVIKSISERNNGVVFLLWGAFAQKKASCVDKNKHHLLTAVHPSPLAASRGFFGCKHFSKCNELLKSQGKEPIDWHLN